MSVFTMRRQDRASRFYSCRLRGGRLPPGTLGLCLRSANIITRSSSIAVERDAAANRRTATRSSNSISRCHVVGFALGGQIVQAMTIERPDLVVTLTMAAAGPGSKTLSGGPRDLSPEAAREIREMGFEQYIKSHIDNDGMAFNPAFYCEHRALATALADALWSGQSTVEQFRYHEEARLTWDALAKAPEVKVPTLILCGADDSVNRRGSTPVGTARRLGELVPGAELALVPGVRHMTFWDGDGALKALWDFLARHPSH
jgi:pimeloyl-ACP methyl ester carboxylesterase